MKKVIFLAMLAGLLVYALPPQMRSFDRMGEQRFRDLNHLPSEIVVGVCWPFSVNQDGMADGLHLALDEINSQKSAGGIPIRLVMRDDEMNWERAKNIAIEFSNDPKMSAVLGYYDDSEAVKASTLYESSRMLHLIVGANTTSLTAVGFQYVVRTILDSEKIGRELAQLSVQRGHKKIAIVWEEGAYGEDLAYQYRISLDSLNGELVYAQSYNRDRADFRLIVNQLKETDADLIFFAGLEPWAGDFLRMLRQVGVKTPVLGAFSDTPEMRKRAGPAIEGSMFFDFYNPASPDPENQEFVRKFRARFGKTPDTWAAQGYDALHILAKAAQTTHSANPLDLAFAIRYMDAWEGANGLYKFDPRGELEAKPLYIDIYRNGAPVTLVDEPPSSEPSDQ